MRLIHTAVRLIQPTLILNLIFDNFGPLRLIRRAPNSNNSTGIAVHTISYGDNDNVSRAIYQSLPSQVKLYRLKSLIIDIVVNCLELYQLRPDAGGYVELHGIRAKGVVNAVLRFANWRSGDSCIANHIDMIIITHIEMFFCVATKI